MKRLQSKVEVKVCEKALLTVEEAAAYTNIGTSRLRAISDEVGEEITVFVGFKRLFKRENLVNWLNRQSRV